MPELERIIEAACAIAVSLARSPFGACPQPSAMHAQPHSFSLVSGHEWMVTALNVAMNRTLPRALENARDTLIRKLKAFNTSANGRTSTRHRRDDQTLQSSRRTPHR